MIKNMAVFTNFATLSYSGGRTESNIVTGELIEVLTASKVAVADDYTSGETIAYALSLINSGSAAIDGLTVTDDLGGYAFGTGTLYPLEYVSGSIRYYQNGTLQTAPTVNAGPPLVISGISVPAGGNVLIVYATKLTDYAPLGTEASITNTATVSGEGITPITVDATVNMRTSASLSIGKAICPSSVTENSRLTYTFVIQNSGNVEATAADEIVLSDLFDPTLDQITVTLNGDMLTATTDYSYDGTSGLFSTAPGRITVPAASYTQGSDGRWTLTPGTATLVISGTL